MDNLKEFSVNGRPYLIGKMTPLVAHRIYNWLANAAARMVVACAKDAGTATVEETPKELTPEEMKEKAESMVEFLWTSASSTLGEDACERIQRHALGTIQYNDTVTNAVVPVLFPDGRWTDKALEQDAPAVADLILESLKSNVSPFFAKGLARPQKKG